MKQGDIFFYVDFVAAWVSPFALRRYIYQSQVHNGNILVKDWHIAIEWSNTKGEPRFFQTSDFEKTDSFFINEKEALLYIEKRTKFTLNQIKEYIEKL